MGKPTLDEFRAFTASHPRKKPGLPCSVCLLPSDLLETLGKAWDEGFRAAALCAYIDSKGLSIGRNKLEHHFRERHHAR